MQDRKIKDPAIKLFGKKISIPAYGETPVISGEDLPSWEREIEKKDKEEEKEIEAEKAEKGRAAVKTTHTLPPDEEKPGRAALKTTDTLPPDEEKPLDPKSLPETNVYSKNTSINKESAKTKASKTQKVQNDATNSQEKTIEKPDKTLPCPRCKSMNTKFCYYNNYNINQPRHFCKACQRYWTAGGAIRNVPVGAGRRKSKNCASRYPHITISEALQAARIGGPCGTFHPAMKTNGRVLSFGLDTPICDSTASALNIADKKDLNDTQNFFHGLEEPRIAVSRTGGEKNSDECSSKSSVTGSNSLAEGGKASPKEPFVQNSNGLTPPISCLPGVPWHCPWNSAFPPPAFCPPRFPMSFYPSYWNYSIPGTSSTGMQSPQSSSSSNQNAPCSNPNSYRLGKHSRDGDMPKPEDSEKEEPSMHKVGCTLVRKILRIDDPSEVAKSSIWTTLEINNESFAGGGLFKAFQTIGAAKNHIAEGSLLLRANPATLSQSINFHERT